MLTQQRFLQVDTQNSINSNKSIDVFLTALSLGGAAWLFPWKLRKKSSLQVNGNPHCDHPICNCRNHRAVYCSGFRVLSTCWMEPYGSVSPDQLQSFNITDLTSLKENITCQDSEGETKNKAEKKKCFSIFDLAPKLYTQAQICSSYMLTCQITH